MGDLTGFDLRSPELREPRSKRLPIEYKEQPFQPPPKAEKKAPVKTDGLPRFWRVAGQETFEAATETHAPKWWREAVLFGHRGEPGLESTPAPDEISLLHWPRLLGFLRHHCIVMQASQSLDERRLARQLAAVRPLRRVPRKVYRRWPQQLILLRDRTQALYPLWDDYERVVERIHRLLGVRLKLVVVESVTEYRQGDFERLLAQNKLTPEAAAAGRWLILSDLGAAEWSAQRHRYRYWQGLLGSLHNLPLRTPPLALVAAPERDWWRGLSSLTQAAFWDRERSLRLSRVPGRIPGQPCGAETGLELLLILLSMAVEARPRLLRKLRRLLPSANQDVSWEVAAWNHEHMLHWLPECYVHPKWRPQYQQRFQALYKKNPELASAALETIRQDHRQARGPVRDQERILRCLAKGATNDTPGWIGDTLYSLINGEENSERHMLLRWADRLIRSTDPAWVVKNDQLASLQEVVANQLAALGEKTNRPLSRGRSAFLYADRPEQKISIHQQGMGWVSSPQRTNGPSQAGSLLGTLSSRDGALWLEIGGGPDLYEAFWLDNAAPDWVHDWGQDEFGLWVDIRIVGKSGKPVIQRLRWIEPGRFMMGSPAEEADRGYDEVRHEVILTQGYWLTDTTTTQALWEAVMGHNPSRFKGAERPVERVSWEEANNFITRLNQQLPGLEMRLPTEAEWEYACRAGRQTPFWFGENVTTDQVNFCGDYPYAGGKKGEFRQETVDVRALPGNGWGLYQMHGNVWEWCSDWYGEYPTTPIENPQGPDSGEGRVLRGGSWFSLGRGARSAQRDHFTPDHRYYDAGFRLARGQSGAEPAGPPAARQRERRAAAGRPSVAPVPRLGRGVVAKPPSDASAPQSIVISSDCERLLLEPTTKPGWAEAIGRDRYGLFTEFSVQEVSQRMRWINPGRFMMGSPSDEAERLNDETQHEVVLSQGFWLAETACTQALWKAVMGDNPSHFKGTERPVEQVSWEKSMRWIARLNEQVPGLDMRLPTEAEWEYACRAGTLTHFWFGENITTDQVNCRGTVPYAGGEPGESRAETVNVMALPCNDWGIYQMHGNVWEWCSDWYGEYPTEPVKDPLGPGRGEERVLRGGSWLYYGRDVRSARRFHSTPDYWFHYIGFRLARGQSESQSGSGWDGQASRSGDGQTQQVVWSKLRGLLNPKKR